MYEGDDIILTCQAGPSYPGNNHVELFIEIPTFIMTFLEISLSWEPENIGWNVTNRSEEYLANSKDPRRIKSSNITVKVTNTFV